MIKPTLLVTVVLVLYTILPASGFQACSKLKCSPSLCCQDTETGPACYSNTQYTCASSGSTKRLCPKGNSVCGTHCFDPTLYTCASGQLQQITGATPVPTNAATIKPTAAATTQPTTAATTKPTTAATTPQPTQQATVAPTTTPTATSPATPSACAVCGSQACCNDFVNGVACYNPSQYSCPSYESGTKFRLCPLGNGACNGTCYQKNAYICTAAGKIVQYSAPGVPGIPTNPTTATVTTGIQGGTSDSGSSTSGSVASTGGASSTTGDASTTGAASTTGGASTTGSSLPSTTTGSVTTGSATTGSAPSNTNGLVTPLQAFCVGTCQSPVSQGFPSGTNAIPRSSPDGVGQWPVQKPCNGGWSYGVPPRATWWDNYSGQAALPTNQWFVPYYSNPPNGVNAQGLTWPVYAMPYTTQATAKGFLMGVPTASFIQSQPGMFDGSPPPVLMYGTTTLQFTFRTTTDFLPGKKIIDFDRDGTGITLQYTTTASQTMTIPVMRGHPFITAIFSSGATPAFDYAIGDIGFVNGINTNNQLTSVVSPTAVGPLFVFDITIVQGTKTAYKFRLYSSQNIPITVSKPTPQGCIVLPWTITFNSPCVGTCTLRLAASLSNYQDPVNPASFYTGKLNVPNAVLDAAANVYPVVRSSNANRTVQFYNGGANNFNQYMYWNTDCVVASDSSCNPANLLMIALPHHLDLLPASRIMTSVSYATQKGIAYGILGNSWTLSFYVPDVVGSTLSNDPFQYQDSITDPTQRAAVLSALPSDMNKLTGPIHYSTFDGADCYSFGKYIAAVARLTLIADSLNQPAIAQQGRTFLRQRLDSWFNKNSSPYPYRTSDELIYDTTWGGIIPATAIQTPGGLWSDASEQPEFGSGGYNDHMFHYGYFLYAVAVTLKSGSAIDVAWFQNDFNHIMALARDIANPDPVADTYFTGFRHKNDWFVGHSWACGLFPTGDYPNVESTSEALNAWYGLYLLGTTMSTIPGLASFGANMQFVGKILAVTDTQSFHYYSRMYPTPTGNRALVYPTQFTALGIIGNLWGGQAIFQTYFGFGSCEDMSAPLLPTYPPSCIQRHILTSDQVRYYNSLMVFLIQAMPFTPFTNSLQNRTWLSQGFLAPALSFKNPDNTVSAGFTPEGKAQFFPDFFGRCANNNGCDSWLAYTWQSDASMGPSNRVNAWNELTKYGSVPAGTTMTNILFHIASQPQV